MRGADVVRHDGIAAPSPRTFPGPVIKTEIDIGITRAVIIDPGTEKIL